MAVIFSDRSAVAGVERQINVAHMIANNSGELRANWHGSAAQLASPLGRWLGLSVGEVATVLHGLGNFEDQALQFI